MSGPTTSLASLPLPIPPGLAATLPSVIMEKKHCGRPEAEEADDVAAAGPSTTRTFAEIHNAVRCIQQQNLLLKSEKSACL